MTVHLQPQQQPKSALETVVGLLSQELTRSSLSLSPGHSEGRAPSTTRLYGCVQRRQQGQWSRDIESISPGNLVLGPRVAGVNSGLCVCLYLGGKVREHYHQVHCCMPVAMLH